MNPWKYVNALRRVVTRVNADQSVDSRSVDDREVQAWIIAGNTIIEPDPPPPPSQEDLDLAAAKGDAKLEAVKTMTPAQIRNWVDTNVTNLAQAKDLLATLAVAVSILWRERSR